VLYAQVRNALGRMSENLAIDQIGARRVRACERPRQIFIDGHLLAG
jgi:hypothetical protein